MGVRREDSDQFHADEEQVAAIQRYVRDRKLSVTILPPELDVSGGKPIEQRPSLLAAIEGVERGVYSGIVVGYLSRLTRSRSGLQIWERVEAAGGHVHCAAENIDTSTPNGRYIRDIHLANAVREREEHEARFDDRRRGATEAGIWQRRQTPIGYARSRETRRLVPDERAPLVQWAFEARAAGVALQVIADRLVMTTGGVRAMLRNRVYLGELRVGKYVNPAAHPPLVSVEAFEAVQRPAPRPGRRADRQPALLAGIVRCQACGHVMPRAGRSYACHGRSSAGRCPEPASVTATLLDDMVIRAAVERLKALRVEQAHTTVDLTAYRDAKAKADRDLRLYVEAVSPDDIGPDMFAAGAKAKKAAVDLATSELQRRMALQPVAPAYGDPVELWEGLTAHERNSLLRALLEVVIVKRAGGRGARAQLADRIRIVRHGAGLELVTRAAGRAAGIVPLPFPDGDDVDVLRVPVVEDGFDGAGGAV